MKWLQRGLAKRQLIQSELSAIRKQRYRLASPELLQDMLNSTKDTVSTLLKIKEKRKAMSNTPTTTLDDQIKQFLGEQYWPLGVDVTQLLNKWESFKASHSSSEKVEKDWEIVQMKSDVSSLFPTVYFDLQPNGMFVSPEWPTEEFDLKEHLLENKIGKKYSIVSVRRLSDGEVFTVGDELTKLGLWSNENRKIKRIYPINGTIAFEYGAGGSVIIQAAENAEKAPIPEEKPVLFTTEDGVKIYAGDYYWFVWTGSGPIAYEIQKGDKADNSSGKGGYLTKYFSTEQAANEYCLLNRPVLSINDVCGWYFKENRNLNSEWDFKDGLKQLASSKIKGGK